MNPKCAAIDKEIKGLQQDLKTAPPSHKAGIAGQIKKLQADLKKCKAKHPK